MEQRARDLLGMNRAQANQSSAQSAALAALGLPGGNRGGQQPWPRQPAQALLMLERLMPQGVLLVGPPGTGKTYFVKGLTREIGFNAVALNMQNILGGIVGQSERNLARALAVVKSLAPCLVFMDELDQSDVSARGNASGNPVAKNLFNMLLQFLGDPANRGRVVFFGASNRPDLMDDALKRSGRIDAIIPVLLPEEPERAAIALAAAQRQDTELGPQTAAYIAGRTDKYSAADVTAVVTKARKIARRESRGAIIGADALRAIDTLRPSGAGQADYFTMLAIQAPPAGG